LAAKKLGFIGVMTWNGWGIDVVAFEMKNFRTFMGIKQEHIFPTRRPYPTE